MPSQDSSGSPERLSPEAESRRELREVTKGLGLGDPFDIEPRTVTERDRIDAWQRLADRVRELGALGATRRAHDRDADVAQRLVALHEGMRRPVIGLETDPAAERVLAEVARTWAPEVALARQTLETVRREAGAAPRAGMPIGRLLLSVLAFLVIAAPISLGVDESTRKQLDDVVLMIATAWVVFGGYVWMKDDLDGRRNGRLIAMFSLSAFALFLMAPLALKGLDVATRRRVEESLPLLAASWTIIGGLHVALRMSDAKTLAAVRASRGQASSERSSSIDLKLLGFSDLRVSAFQAGGILLGCTGFGLAMFGQHDGRFDVTVFVSIILATGWFVRRRRRWRALTQAG